MFVKGNIAVYIKSALVGLLFLLPAQQLFAQTELMPYGNLTGIRIKGQLMAFDTRIVVAGDNWKKVYFTGKELQQPKFMRNGDEQVVTTKIDSIHFTETVKDIGRGKARITIKCFSAQDTTLDGIYFNVMLPPAYRDGVVKLGNQAEHQFSQTGLGAPGMHLQHNLEEISFSSASDDIGVKQDTISNITFRNDEKQKNIGLYFPICSGKIGKGVMFERTYEIRVSGSIDDSPAEMKLDASAPGRVFDGLGGNFRIQNPKLDPEVIDYCLKNLRVAWGRVEMPWISWQPDSTVDPAATDTAMLNVRVKRAMEMAQRLSRMNIPVIVTAWFPPAWAVEGKLSMGRSPEGIWGNPLKASSMNKIYQSITDYIIYLKAHYGVEAADFSFNESDLGINVRQTAEEHDELIKGLGAYFASHGLTTKLLLGDNSDATTYNFIYPAMNDPRARPYMGMVSFHSWRGWDTPTLQKWADAAKQTNLPLLVGEGSIDAAAWGYPQYFLEQSYALEEINLYTRLLAICQPISILQWQLTSDYSPLKGGGIFGDNGPLEPTQRFWNLKQLASTPKDLRFMPVTSNVADISCAALGDNAKHIYTIHIVNNGTGRKVHLSGIPAGVNKLNIYVTNIKSDMKEKGSVKISNGEGEFKAGERSFITLTTQ
ncbi:hypothetical protein [Mucilaginibacter sp.]|jgi:hypothetical protein|uniref:hypothetical protein n=1 Tax=Mucilaginibacter sp. TaxID=1882438 RepID=UPI002CF6AE8D|nr:hypothetical protein [Mucilaginibacter sp.]HTI60269.1 hypothetical protein [Mucilaginibacter sp.]